MKQTTTAIYLRVSSNQQETASQEPELTAWAAKSDGPVVYYRDKFSGKTMDRPGWNKLMADVNAGKVDRIVCWRLDRLGRTAKGLTALFEDLTRLKVNLVSIKDGLDLSTAAGRLMANVLASVAQFETEVRAERVLAGQSAARAAGKKWGGSMKGKITVQSTSAEKIETIQRLAAEGMKIAAIARATGCTRPTVYKHLGQ